jgi:hypothetical protein
MRIRICRKEAKESRLFLRLLEAGMSAGFQSARQRLEQEADELTRSSVRSFARQSNYHPNHF